MSESKASRTLVKSPPELWSEVSSASSLQRHLDQFGEIRITKLEPETAVAWEGEHARGSITLEASGWGTKVHLTAEPLQRNGQDADPRDEPSEREPAARDRVDPGPTGETRVELAYDEVEVKLRALTGFLERNRREAEVRKRRWPRRAARALRALFVPAPEFTPSQPVISDLEPGATEVEQPDAPLSTGETPEPTPEPPEHALEDPEPTPGEPSTAALICALDSLGQAHHRPYSRA